MNDGHRRWAALAARAGRVGRWLAARPWLLAVILLLLLHRRLLSRRWCPPWDAAEFVLPMQHWFASAVRAGEDPSWCPLIAGGFPVARELQFGYMGLLHPLTALAFGGTTLAVSVPVLALFLTAFGSVHAIARLLGLGPWPSVWAGLWAACSGWWLGNASHLPVLAAATFTLLIAAGLLGFARGRPWAPLAVTGGWVLAVNGAYPTTLLFGGQMLGLLGVVLLIGRILSWRRLLGFLAASVVGVAAGLPTLLSAYTWFGQTWRGAGLTAAQTLARSTAPQALLTFFRPLIPVEACHWPGAVDVTLDRFHLTFAALPLLVLALGGLRRWRGLGWACAGFVLLGVDFCLGRHAYVRAFLTEHLWFERLNRCLPADHGWLIPAALAVGLAAVLDVLWRSHFAGRRRRVVLVNLLLAADVALVVLSISRGLVVGRAGWPWRPPPAPAYQVVWTAEDQARLDAGRDCDEARMKRIDNTPSLPDRFLPWGFVSAGVKAYEADFFARRLQWICGPGKLRDARDAAPVDYRLVRYAPTEVRFVVPASAPRDLVWNDVDDGWWTVTVDGRDVSVPGAPSGLRRFVLPPGEAEVRMIYRSRWPIWSGWLAALGGLVLAGAWSWSARAGMSGQWPRVRLPPRPPWPQGATRGGPRPGTTAERLADPRVLR